MCQFSDGADGLDVVEVRYRNMDSLKPTTCPTCGYENLPGTLLCVRCYSLIEQPSGEFPAAMPPTGLLNSQPTPTSPLTAPNPIPPSRGRMMERLEADAVALVIEGREDPLIIQVTNQAVLGRYTPNNPMQPLVDLSPYGALDKGVSRMHVIIRRTNKGLIAEDMASSNGTILNEMRLAPYSPAVINPGDRLRLGKLDLEIYFNETPR
ncbi:MAG: FHA domain-containing protein [Anaerolineae bacterium]|nr:FHA domain-containing protein [Anaerolineae bacterium]